MVRVAVAGGTGHLGRTLVEAIIATGKHEVKVFSRKVCLLESQENCCKACPDIN